MAEISRQKRHRHGKKFDQALNAFRALDEAARTPDGLRKFMQAAGVAPEVIEREIAVAESLFGHLATRVASLTARLQERGR
jgi:hypothetical protein